MPFRIDRKYKREANVQYRLVSTPPVRVSLAWIMPVSLPWFQQSEGRG
jgi:hypothetical protein